MVQCRMSDTERRTESDEGSRCAEGHDQALE